MSFELNEEAIGRELAPIFGDPVFRAAVKNLVSDPVLLTHFLVSTSQGEGMGEAGVAAIREDDIAGLMRDMDRQQDEERGHKEITLEIARAINPGAFEDGHYRHEAALTGKDYYLGVVELNRNRLKERGRYSRLNLYLTTSFGFEVMVLLLYQAIIDGLERSTLPPELRDEARAALQRILAEEEGHLEIVDQHNELLAADRTQLSAEACAALDMLSGLTAEDYRWCAELAVKEIVRTYAVYADAAAAIEEIRSAA